MNRITTRQIECGATLIVENIPGVRSVGMTWTFPGAGGASDPADRRGVSAMWEELLMRGAGSLSSRAQADVFDTLGFSRSADATTSYFSITGAGLGSRLEEALPLFVDMVRRPRFDEASIEPARDLCLQAIEALKDDPQERASALLREKHMRPPFDRSSLGTVEGLRAVCREDAAGGWLMRTGPEGAIITLAGAVRADHAAGLLDGLLRGWRGGGREPEPTGEAERGYHHVTDETNQEQILIAHDAPAERDEDSMVERVIVAALSGGMSSRLFTEVREKRSLCYSVHASYRSERDDGRVVAYVGTTPERAQEALDVLWRELTRINRSSGGSGDGDTISAEEYARAVVGLKSRTVMAGESTGARAAALAADWRRLGRARSLDEILAAVDAATLARVHARLAMRAPGKATVVTLGPTELKSPA